MNSYIKAICVLSKEGERKEVEFTSGLNIITGESKSGKSALLEIIDYCMGSSRSYIPKGIITNFTEFFVTVFRIGTLNLIVGRKSFEDNGRKQMYVIRTKTFDINDIKLELFTEETMITVDQAKKELEAAFGMEITDMSDNTNKKEGRPSVRNMTSYLFQHQNLIANKFALFYRFDDYYKKEDVIKQFPIFAGWVDQEYYSLLIQLDELEKNKKRNERDKTSYNNAVERLRGRLIKSFISYYALLGKELDENTPIHILLQLRKKLPDFTRESYLSEEMEVRYFALKERLELKRREKHDLDLTVKNLELSRNYGDSYQENLKRLDERGEYSKPEIGEYVCPLCGKPHEKLNEKMNDLNKSKKWLQNEIQGVGEQNLSFFAELNHLNHNKRSLTDEIKDLTREIERTEGIFKGLKDNKRLDEQIIYYKAKIDSDCEIVESQRSSLAQLAESDYDSDISFIKNKIKAYNVKFYEAEAMTFINGNINRIIEKLDFEEEYRPTKIKFELDTFNLYHEDKINKTNVYLSEMGSGANWLSCHLSLFLSLLHYFAVQKTSILPSFLFIDQPSQVYFPPLKTDYINFTETQQMLNSKDKEVVTVENMYIAILDEIELINEAAGFRPQIIITDHVDHMDLGKYDFNDYVRRRWRDSKFI